MLHNNIPFEIQAEIMKRSPVESLIRFRSVSKQWKSMIDSSEFVTDHHTANQHHHLLVRYEVAAFEGKYVLIVDDDSFPRHKFYPSVCLPVKKIPGRCSFMIDCSHGLVCLFGYEPHLARSLVILWNPSIRKSVGIVLPGGFSALGFGVCPKTRDPKVLKIRGIDCKDQEAEVFTLTSRAWRSVSMKNLPYISMNLLSHQVVVDGTIYWVAAVKITNNKNDDDDDDDDDDHLLRIISFDLTREEFGQLDLPNSLAREVVHAPLHLARPTLCVSKLKESLLVLYYHPDPTTTTGDDAENKPLCDVWMLLKTGSFIKLFTVKVNAAAAAASDGLVSCDVIGFRRNGQPILKQVYRRDDGVRVSKLEVYGSEHSTIGVYESFFKTAFYTESLLLHDYTGGSII